MIRLIYLQVIIVLFSYLGCTSALTMEGVSIMGGKEFFRMQEEGPYVLECKYTLKEGETTNAITWYKDEFKAFFWSPSDSHIVGDGLYLEDPVLTRTDGNLEFAALRTALAGKYRCEVMTSAGETYKSFDLQLLIVDMPENHSEARSEVKDCLIKFSWDAPAVKPKPDINCGVWSTVHGYILMATNWMATPYYNGSVAYSVDDEVFEIFQMPLDAIIRCEIKITKVDDTHVLLMEKSYNFTEVWERGCPPLEVGDGVSLEYDNERPTCHAEVKPKDEAAPVIAHVKCEDGYTPKYEDFVSSVDMICKGTQWDIGGDLTWNHFDNLLCIEKPVLPQTTPLKKQASHTHESDPSDEISSGVNSLLTPAALIFLLGITLLSGIVWSVKTYPKKKDERYMA